MLRIAAALVVIGTIFALSPARDAAPVPEADPRALMEAWRMLPEDARDALAREILGGLGAEHGKSAPMD